jgi:hypothetical protein
VEQKGGFIPVISTSSQGGTENDVPVEVSMTEEGNADANDEDDNGSDDEDFEEDDEVRRPNCSLVILSYTPPSLSFFNLLSSHLAFCLC